LTDTASEASEDFVHKVEGLLEDITGKPYAIAKKFQLEKALWAVYFDEDQIKGKDRLSMNEGAYWVQEDKDGTIRVYSDKFYDVGDVASEEYDFDFQDENVLRERRNWEKFREKVPGLIAELEAAERAAKEANGKYGTEIGLYSGEKPRYWASFGARDMGEGEKLREIGRHAKAMLEAWGRWQEWCNTWGREVYMKTRNRVLDRMELMDEVIHTLGRITNGWYGHGFRKPGVKWSVVEADTSDKDIATNRGAWRVEETKDSIVITSDNWETINARGLREYRLIKRRGKATTQEDKEGFVHTIISPELIRKVAEQVGQEFGVSIQVSDNKPLMITQFKTAGLKSYGKVYEIERHAKPLAEAWRRIKDLQGV
jgi:hypothetical protein